MQILHNYIKKKKTASIHDVWSTLPHRQIHSVCPNIICVTEGYIPQARLTCMCQNSGPNRLQHIAPRSDNKPSRLLRKLFSKRAQHNRFCKCAYSHHRHNHIPSWWRYPLHPPTILCTLHIFCLSLVLEYTAIMMQSVTTMRSRWKFIEVCSIANVCTLYSPFTCYFLWPDDGPAEQLKHVVTV